MRSLDNYVYTKNGCEIEYCDIIGTGCLVFVKQNNTIIETYTIILYGDVNGDGWYDGQDSFIVNCIVNGYLTSEQVGEAKWMAADCDHDGEITAADVAILEQAGLLLANVDQTASQEDLMQSDSYMEYLELIDQNPFADETAETPVEEPAQPEAKSQTILDKIIAFVKIIIDFIRSFAVKI